MTYRITYIYNTFWKYIPILGKILEYNFIKIVMEIYLLQTQNFFIWLLKQLAIISIVSTQGFSFFSLSKESFSSALHPYKWSNWWFIDLLPILFFEVDDQFESELLLQFKTRCKFWTWTRSLVLRTSLVLIF